MTRRPAVAAALLAAAALAASATLAAATPAALAAAPAAITTTATTVTQLGAALAEQASDADPSAAAKKKSKKKTKKKARKASKKKARKASKKRWKRAATHTAPAAAPAPAPAPVAVPSGTEDYVTILINQHRTANGCAPLHTNTNLTTAARAYSTDMATHNYFSHTGRDGSTFVQRAHRAGYPNPGGENIAWGYATANDVTTGWMNSPGHRANILNCTFTTTGVGIATNPNGTPYYTQLFGR